MQADDSSAELQSCSLISAPAVSCSNEQALPIDQHLCTFFMHFFAQYSGAYARQVACNWRLALLFVPHLHAALSCTFRHCTLSVELIIAAHIMLL